MGPLQPQTNYQLAFDQALARAHGQSPASFKALGAQEMGDGRYELPVLEATFVVDLARGSVTRTCGDQPASEGAPVGLAWQILTLHYLCASHPWTNALRWVSFAHFVDARGYEPVYRQRVVARFCATAGRDRDTFLAASRQLGAEPVDWGEEGFRFYVFPQAPVVIAWYRGDEEFPPNASFVYPDNILSFLPIEDVIVLSEKLVSRLQGKGW